MSRVNIGLHWAKIVAVTQGEARLGGSAPQWVASGVTTRGHLCQDARILGSAIPKEGSWALFGAIEGNATSMWCLPTPWTSAPPSDVGAHQMLQELPTISFRVRDDGTYSITTAQGDQLLRLEPGAGHGGGDEAQLLDGSRRLARQGDTVLLDAETAPNLFMWMSAMTLNMNLLVGAAGNPVPPGLSPVPGFQDVVQPTDDQPGGETGLVGKIATDSPWSKAR